VIEIDGKTLKLTTTILLILLLSTTVYAQAEEPAPETTIEPTTSTETTTEPTTTLQETEPTGEEPTGGDGEGMLLGDGEYVDPSFVDKTSGPESHISGNDFLQTSLYTGAATYTYPLEVPPGTNGLAPSLFITYNSQSAKGRASFVGLGWDLSLSYIQRNVNYTPDNTSDDEFNLILNGNSYELIYNSTEQRYHTKTESYLYIKNQSGAPNENGTYWTVRTKDGTEYRLGYNNDSETLANGRDYVWRWSLDKVNDTHNNNIHFNYSENPTANDNGTVYLDKIEYNNDGQRVIEFVLENSDRPDKTVVYDQGSKVREARRLKEINVFTNASLVRKYTLSYTTSNSSRRSLLSSITEYGSDNTSSLPPTNFEYQVKQNGFDDIIIWNGTKYDITNIDLDGNLEGATIDMNRDGLPDNIKTFISSWKIHLNNGTEFPTSEYWSHPTNGDVREISGGSTINDTFDITGDGLPDYVVSKSGSSWSVYPNNGAGFNSTSISWDTSNIGSNIVIRKISDGETKIDTFDINGDGWVDYINSTDDTDYWLVYLGHWGGFNDPINWSAPYDSKIRYIPTYGVYEGRTLEDTFDINGDALPDFVDTTGVYLNTGSGFEEEATQGFNTSKIRYVYQDVVYWDIFDINGDGLPDKVDAMNTDYWLVHINNGSGFEDSGINLSSPGPYDVDEEDGLVDINGDGLLDYINDTNNADDTYWNVRLNKGSTPDLLCGINNSLGGTTIITYVPSTKFDNTGDDDLSDLGFPMQVVNSTITDNGITGIHNVNSTTTYFYANGSYDFEDREFRGFGYVMLNDSYNSTVEHRFNQSDALKGRKYSTVIKDSLGNLYAKTENNWSFTQSGEIYVPTLDQVDGYTYDGSVSNPNITRTRYDYDDYGNINGVSFLGSPGISGDEKYIENYYHNNSANWIVDRIKQSILKASDNSTMGDSYYAYDSQDYGSFPTRGDLTKELHWLDTGDDPEVEYGYDSYGNMINMTDAEGHTTNYTYGITDGTYTFSEQIVNALGQAYNYSYDLGTGNLNWSKDPNGYNATYEYDVFGRIIKEIQPYDSSSYPTVAYNYSRDGSAPEMVNVSIRKTAGQSGTLDALTFVDGFGRVIQIKTDAEDTSKQIIANTYYDELGRVESQSVPYLDTKSNSYSTPSSTKNTSFSYDCLSRNTQTTNTDGTTRNQTYDHLKFSIVDENSHQKTFFLDAHNQIIQVQENNSGSLYNTTYGYNARDELINITDNEGNIFNFSYDSLGRKTNISDPDMGKWNYSYDGVGNLLNQTDARGTTTKFEYDSLNRITEIDYQTDTDVTYDYDLENIGTLSQINDSVGTAHYYYDQRLRTTAEERTADSKNWLTNWSYDSMDRVTNMTYPSGQKVNYSYNAQGELDSIPNIVYNINYNALGKITLKAYQNGVATNLYYNPDHYRLERIYASGKQDINYTFDNVGNIILINDTLNSENHIFTYDTLDRLLTASIDGGYNKAYNYSSIGNILTVNESGTVQNYTYGVGSAGPHALTNYTDTTTSCGCTGSQPPSSGDWDIDEDTSCSGSDIDISGGLNINNDHTLTLSNGVLYLDGDILMDGDLTLGSGSNVDFGGSGGSCSSSSVLYNLTYDENGNLIEGFGFTFDYDNANRLANVSNSSGLVAEYFYDSNGQRFKKNESGTVTYYVGGHYEDVAYTNGSVVNTSYYFANGERVAKKSQGTAHYFHPDHLGSTNVISDSSGTLVETTKYYPFGSVRAGGTEDKYGFTDQELDSETGLMYYGARYYSPEVRRFAQADPMVSNPYNPQSLNRYSYTLNNPLIYIDPTGYMVTAASPKIYEDEEGNKMVDLTYRTDGEEEKQSQCLMKNICGLGRVLVLKPEL